MSPTIILTTMFVHHKSADYDNHRHLYHTRHIGCYGGDLSSYVMSQLSGQHMQTLWLIAHNGTHTTKKNITYLKKRGWCVMLLSCSTFLLSLWSCSILCFCSSAPSVFPSSKSLDRKDKKSELG